jgi:hypothetical protein
MTDQGWNLLIYTAQPGTPSADALRLLASWAATREQENAPESTNPTTSNPTTSQKFLNPGRPN